MQKTPGGQTRTESFHTRERRLTDQPTQTDTQAEELRPRHGEHLTRNLATASALVLCAVALRQGALPGTENTVDKVMTTVTDNSLLDDTLGKLSFVSALFPEATLVFGEQSSTDLALPVDGGALIHAWSEEEPYTTWRSSSRVVTASLSGEVIGVYHGEGEERLVQVMADDGLACLYGNLAEVTVNTGDAVTVGDKLGEVLTGSDCVMELRRDGVSIDPSGMLP